MAAVVERDKMKSETTNSSTMNGNVPEIQVNGNSNVNGSVSSMESDRTGESDMAKLVNGLRDLPPVPSLKENSPPPLPANPPRNSVPHKLGPSASLRRAPAKFIPEHEIEIPKDGCIYDFSTEDMSTFLRYMGVEERIVIHTNKKGLDGKRFSRMKDSELEALGMKNPIICHFRDRSIKEKGGKKKSVYMFL